MKWLMSKTDYIDILQGCSSTLRNDYGIKSLRLFGSIARGEDHENSDVDVLVEMPPKFYEACAANDYLEEITGCHVDMIRRHKNLTPFFLKQVERDGVRIF